MRTGSSCSPFIAQRFTAEMTETPLQTQRCFEDVSVGDIVTPITRGPMSPMHIMRWSAAIENWHRIHYDWPFATEHDGLPNVLVNGSLKQHFLVQLMREWLGSDGWLWQLSYRFRRMDVAWDTLTVWGTVTEVREYDGFGVVACEVGIRNSRGEESTTGGARGALPYRDGPAVPYPFPQGLIW
jgi:acyl dehydratase